MKIDVLLLLVALSVSLACSLPCQGQVVGRVRKLEQYGVEVNIGQRSSVMEGSRASLRSLARLARRYPKRSLFKVNWIVRFPRETVQFVSQYDRSHRSVSREAYAANPAISEKFRYGFDEATDRDLRGAARRGESFFELGERILKRALSHRAPQNDSFQLKLSTPPQRSHWYETYQFRGF